VTIGGVFDATASKTLELDATTVGGGTGAVTQTAALTNVGTLTGNAGTVTLTRACNSIVNRGSFAAMTGHLDLVNNRDLSVTGPVAATAGTVNITTTAGSGTLGSLTMGAAVMAGTDVILKADETTNGASFVNATRDAALTAVAGDINGAPTARRDATLSAGNTINGGASASGSATLTAGNDINNSGVTATASFATLTATGGNITDDGGVTAGTTVSLTAGKNVTQNATTITAPASVTVIASAGTIGQTACGTISATGATGTVALTAATDILFGGTLSTGAGGATGSVALTANAGQISETAAGEEIAHPFFWAPFAVIGEGDERAPASADSHVSPRRLAGL